MVVLPAGIVVTGVFTTAMGPCKKHLEILQNSNKAETSPFLQKGKRDREHAGHQEVGRCHTHSWMGNLPSKGVGPLVFYLAADVFLKALFIRPGFTTWYTKNPKQHPTKKDLCPLFFKINNLTFFSSHIQIRWYKNTLYCYLTASHQKIFEVFQQFLLSKGSIILTESDCVKSCWVLRRWQNGRKNKRSARNKSNRKRERITTLILTYFTSVKQHVQHLSNVLLFMIL